MADAFFAEVDFQAVVEEGEEINSQFLMISVRSLGVCALKPITVKKRLARRTTDRFKTELF